MEISFVACGRPHKIERILEQTAQRRKRESLRAAAYTYQIRQFDPAFVYNRRHQQRFGQFWVENIGESRKYGHQ
jgi:uncharacterized protein YebE (UPF0316 family)